MPADASIYSLIRPQQAQPGPLDQYTQGLQLRSLIDDQGLKQLQRQQLEKGIQDERAVSDAYMQSKGDPVKLRELLYGGGQYKAAIAAEKAGLETEKTRGDIDKTKAETHKLQIASLRDQLASVADDNQLAAARETAMRLYGPSVVANMPQSVNAPGFAEWRNKQLVTADEMLKRSTPKLERQDVGDRVVSVDMNPFTNPGATNLSLTKTVTPGEKLTDERTRSEGALNRGVTMRGQNQPVWDEQRGVFVQRPGVTGGGAPGPIGGGGGSPAPGVPQVIRPEGLPARNADVAELRKEFNALPEVKQYRDVLPIIGAAQNAPDTLAGDIQMAYAVGKILDPNSVVREGELKLVGEARTVLEKYSGELRAITQGKGRLTPATRAELTQMLNNAVNQREGAYKQAEETYKGVAAKNGIPMDQVIITPQARQPDAPKTQTFKDMPDPKTLKGKRIKSDDGTIYKSDGSKWVRE